MASTMFYKTELIYIYITSRFSTDLCFYTIVIKIYCVPASLWDVIPELSYDLY